MNNRTYTITHCHTMLSNGITNIDSVTSYEDYIDFIKKNKETYGINSICFTEHGSVFEWYKKKCAVESLGLKYIHSIEIYVTETLEEKKRDNYHVCLYAKNYDGFLELNKLSSKAFNREDGHYYYVPRITFNDLINTSDNIIITTACMGGILIVDLHVVDLIDDIVAVSQHVPAFRAGEPIAQGFRMVKIFIGHPVSAVHFPTVVQRIADVQVSFRG